MRSKQYQAQRQHLAGLLALLAVQQGQPPGRGPFRFKATPEAVAGLLDRVGVDVAPGMLADL